MRFLLALCSFAFLSACQPEALPGPGDATNLASASEDSCGFVRNLMIGQRISWKKNIPVTVAYDDSFPAQYLGSLQAAVEKWNTVAGRNLLQIQYRSNITAEKNKIIWKTSWDEKRKSTQGLTYLVWDKNQIQRSEVHINGQDYSYCTSVPSANCGLHLESLLVHELGHVLGLDHRRNTQSVMLEVLNEKVDRTAPQHIDIESLKCEY